MSRNSSGRSSYSYKSQEDFQDEILDLKKQLARLKEESRTLKVKLRRSEENAARKEKIICNMIDPLKAHLSAKSVKCQNKGSQKKEAQKLSKCTSQSKVCHHSTCSRAYRHSAKSYEISKDDHSLIFINDLPRSEKKKKCLSKVPTVVESMHEPHNDLPKAILSVRPLAVKDCRSENSSSPVVVNNGEVNARPITNISKTREGTSISPLKSSNPQNGRVNKKNTKGKTKKKKSVTEKNARSLLFQLCASSENEEDSYSSYGDTYSSKSVGNAQANHTTALGARKVPHDSDNCKRCHSKFLKSDDYASDNAVTCKIENLIKGGKNLLSMWDEDNGANMKHMNTQGNFKSIYGEGHSHGHALGKEDGSNKFGIYLINEHDEIEDSGCVDIIVAEDESETLESWREVDNKANPSCVIERKASIFRVDIKKKDPNNENEYIEGVNSHKGSNEMIYRGSCCKEPKESAFSAAIREEMGMCEVPMDAECQVMEHLLETLSVTDGMARNNFEMMGSKSEKSLRNMLENLLAVTESENGVEKSVENKGGFQEGTNMKNLCSTTSNCSPKCLTGMVSRGFKSMCQKVNSFPSHVDFISHQSCGVNFHDNAALLGILSLPCETSTQIPLSFENI